MIRIAICDDEPCMIDLLSQRVAAFFRKKHMDIDILSFSDGNALLACTEEPDILFLDIQMKRPDGLETARLLRQRNYRGFLVFVTAYREYVFNSFEVEAFDYLIKPLCQEAFVRTMERLTDTLRGRSGEHLLIRREGGMELVPFADILYCEVINRKVYLHLRDTRILSYYEKIERLEQKLDPRFFRCHRSYLINLQHLKSCKKGAACLTGGLEVPVSRLRQESFSAAIMQYMKHGR